MAWDCSDDDFDFRFRCEKRATKIFERLHTLVQAGYIPDFSSEFVEAFWLRHPSDKFKHNRLTIYPSGLVLSSNENTDEFRFYLDDEARFRRFLRQVPRPTWWDRSRETRLSILAMVLVWGGLIMFGWIFGSIVEQVLKSIGRAFGIL